MLPAQEPAATGLPLLDMASSIIPVAPSSDSVGLGLVLEHSSSSTVSLGSSVPPDDDPTVLALTQPEELSEPSRSALVGRRGQTMAPDCSIVLRRSTRSTKYDGFKVPSVTDTPIRKAKVKPRTGPSASAATTTDNNEATTATAPPPPTPIQVIQHIGTTLCAIPASELSEEALLSDKETGPSSASV